MMKEPLSVSRLYAEDERGTTVALMPRLHRNYGQRFFTMFETTATTLCQWDRPSVYWRVLFHLLGRLDPVQYRRVSAQEVREAVQISASSAERALAMLEADQVIFTKGATSAKARRLNNRLVWKANSEKWNEATPDPEVRDGRGR